VRGKLENLIIFYSYLHLYFSLEKFKFEARLLLHHSDLSKTSCDTCRFRCLGFDLDISVHKGCALISSKRGWIMFCGKLIFPLEKWDRRDD
jgi:hypothetical protein